MLGIAFLVGIGLDRGWIDESMRIIFGLLGSTALLLVGVWLYERKGQTQAALAAAGGALAGLDATLLVGTQIYDLIPAEVGLAAAGLVGIVGVAIAVRWESTIAAAIGILGALSAPLLAGTGTSGLSLAFIAIALAAAVGVLLWQRWNWLSIGAFAVSAPQLVASNAELLLAAAGASLGLALGHTLLFEAPPEAIVAGVADLGEAVVGLGACAAAALYGRFALRKVEPRVGPVCEAAAAVVLLYLGSVTIVNVAGVTSSGGTRQIGQALLSAFWAVTGLGAVVYGLLRDIQRFRIAGLGLLALAIAKVYTYDLAALEQLPRVLSLIVLGLLLLVGAFAYQRIRVGDDDAASAGEEG